jgi:hypothetical protein
MPRNGKNTGWQFASTLNMKNSDKPKTPVDPDDRKQTDLAEGELNTVEESIRKHEEKGDQQGGGKTKDAA